MKPIFRYNEERGEIMTIGNKITELRKKENMTIEKLSRKIGISRQTLSNWESDITSPNLKEAKEIASIFQVSLDDLVNHSVDINCKKNNSILNRLIGKECYIEILEEDYRLEDDTLCKVIDVSPRFLKIEFLYGKETITKLIDLELVSTIRMENKK